MIRSALCGLLVALAACGSASADLRERAVLHERAGRLGEALAAARSAVEVAPGDADSRVLLARLEGQAGRPGAMLRELEAAELLGGGDDRALADLLARRGQARAALGHVERWRDLERAVRLDGRLAGRLHEARRSALLDGGLARWARGDGAGADALWARAPGPGLGLATVLADPERAPLPLLAGLGVRAWRVAGLRAWPILEAYVRRGGDDPRALRSFAAARRARDPRQPAPGFAPSDAVEPAAALGRFLTSGSLAPVDGETLAGVLALSASAWARGERDSAFDDDVLRWVATQPAPLEDVPAWARPALARLRGEPPVRGEAGEVPGHAVALAALDFAAVQPPAVDPASRRRRGEASVRGSRLLPVSPLVPAGCPADRNLAAELARLADAIVASPPEAERAARELVDVALVPSCRGLAVAELLLRARDPARARRFADELVVLEPGDADALALAFQAALAQRDAPAARLYLEAREAAAAVRGWPSVAAARRFQAAGDAISALAAARQALALGEGPVRRAAFTAAADAALAAGRDADAARYQATALAELAPGEQARFAATGPRARALAEGGAALQAWVARVPEDDLAVIALDDDAALDRALVARPWSITLLAARVRRGDQAGRNAARARLARIASGADDDERAERAAEAARARD